MFKSVWRVEGFRVRCALCALCSFFNHHFFKTRIATFNKSAYFCIMQRTGRHPRIHIRNTIHHVMIRGNNRQQIFFNENYFNHFLKILEESTIKFDHDILAFCLMSNHAHLLIHIHDDKLSDIMKNINYRYARWVNHKQKRIGHLFQGRFRSIQVGNEIYLINLCRYIHFNPVEAKIVKDPVDYPWSSHHYYSLKKNSEWVNVDFILTAIKNTTSFDYSDFISKPIDREKWKPCLYILEDGNIIIDEDIVRNLNSDLENINEMACKTKFLPHTLVSDAVCRNLNIKYDRLIGGSRDRLISKKRMLLAHYWIAYSNLTVVDVAKKFNRTHGTLLRQLDHLRINNRYFSDEMLRKIDAELELNLARI